MMLGGASRTGKSLISRELLSRLALPYLSIDPIKMALSKAVPSYELNTDESSIVVSEQLWPFISALARNMVETGVHYLIEGEILPWQVAQLSEQLEVRIPACFVGYENTVIEQKMADIKSCSGMPNDWTAELTDAQLFDLVSEGVEFSRYLRSQCAQYGLYYQDFSTDFTAAKSAVIHYFESTFKDH
ncbi:hypothetical protein BGP77_04135 [Saccharospirillum sp. MSK14-1]|nr:hypothetical protein BGP77_04135 [Saccharospirillum sp. MSK14-1]